MKKDKSIKINQNNDGIANTGDNNTFYQSSVKPQTLQQAITEWKSQTKIPLNPNLVLQSREKEVEELFSLLSQSPSKIIVVSPRSEEESYAFIINALNIQEDYTDRVKIIKSQEAWDITVDTEDSLILVYKGFIPTNIGLAIKKGHSVIEAEESINLTDNPPDIIKLSKIRKSNQVETLKEMGLDCDKAWKVYDDTKGFLYAIAQHPLLQPMERVHPDWVSSYSMDILSTILFINSWNRDNESDTQIIEQLSGMSYSSFETELHNLKKEKNAPIRLVGNVWQVISKINLWDLIADRLSMAQIEKLKPILLEVFTEIDPAYEMPPTERWAAHIYEKVMKHSGHIRGNLADTLSLLSSFGDSKITFSSSMKILIDSWLRELFETNHNVEAWYSYHSELSLLAEASPDNFLKAIEQTLKDAQSTRIEELFADGGNMGGCFHCSLLWALESISWNLDYFPRVVSVLSSLSELNIESNMGNQPFNSLRDMFLGWTVSSSVTHKERIEILEYILLKNYPNTTWKLLLELLPSSHTMTSPISSPRYQDWDDIEDIVLERDYVNYCNDINSLLFENLDEDNQKWYDIFDNIDKLYEEYLFKIVDKFITLDKKIFDDNIALLIANTLRSKIYNHRSHPDTNWALPKKFIDKLEEAFHFIEPDDLIGKYQYLFGMGSVNILKPIPYNPDTFNEDYKKEDITIEALRKEAIEHILSDGSLDDLKTLIKQSSYAWDIGRIVFELYEEKYQETMLGWVEGEDRLLMQCAKSYLQQYARKSFDVNILNGLSDVQKSEMILALPFVAKAFEIIKIQDTNVQKMYWKNISWYYRLESDDITYFSWVTEQFYKYGHFIKIIDFVGHCINDIKSGKLCLDEELMYSTLVELNPNEEKYNTHSLAKVIKLLQSTKIKNDRMQLLEWKYLGLNTFHPVYLEKAILNEPTFFVELVSWIYKPKNSTREDNDLTEEETVNRAKNASNLLDKVSLYKATDKLSTETLRDWITVAKEEFIKVDRVGIGDDQIGKQLAQSPVGDDGILPNEVTREALEEFINDKIETAFCVAIQNQRGVVWKDAEGGGIAEYALSDKYTAYADGLKFRYPKTAKAMKRIADSYLYQAKQEDLESEL